MLKEILENLNLEKLLTSNGVTGKHITFNKIKKLNDEEKFEIVKACLDIDGNLYNLSNVIKVYSSYFYNLIDGKFSGKNQDIYTDTLGNKYTVECVSDYSSSSQDLPKFLTFYKKGKFEEEINLDEVNEIFEKIKLKLKEK